MLKSKKLIFTNLSESFSSSNFREAKSEVWTAKCWHGYRRSVAAVAIYDASCITQSREQDIQHICKTQLSLSHSLCPLCGSRGSIISHFVARWNLWVQQKMFCILDHDNELHLYYYVDFLQVLLSSIINYYIVSIIRYRFITNRK